MFNGHTSSMTGLSTRWKTMSATLFHMLYNVFSKRFVNVSGNNFKIPLILHFKVQNNGSAANLMPHDIADLGGLVDWSIE